MILVKLNQANFEYDIHSLIKAFYPRENVRVTAEEKTYDEHVDMVFEITYLPDTVRIVGMKDCFWQDAQKESAPGGEKASSESEGREYRCEQAEDGCFADEVFAADYADRIDTKNRLKRKLYEILAAHTGRMLPWGTLTGIRPTKIPMKMMEAGGSEEEIAAHMRREYYVSAEKINLSTEIAKRELALLNRLDYENGYSLYIGIPFCPTTCLYCSFTSNPVAAWSGRMDDYLRALEREIEFTAEAFGDKHLNTVYIGGGTPTTLEPGQLERLLGKVKKSFSLEHCLEFTVEAGRPDSITGEKLSVLRDQGISRISINPQTMKQETLQTIGRHHTVEQTIESFHMARALGFDNINMDLILGLPGESLEDVASTLKQIQALAPDNLTVHSLALKRAARLSIEWEDYKGYQMVNTQRHMDLAMEYAAQMGLLPYYLYRQKGMAGNLENVGFAAEGMAGIYNILIMEEKQTIVALGAGSITKRIYPDGQAKRCENVKDVAQYIGRIEEMIERKKRLFED